MENQLKAIFLEGYPQLQSNRSIPVPRIIEKMNEYMSRLDYSGAEKHLNYWLDESRMLGDGRGELTILNELIGHDRKTGQREMSIKHSQEALELIDKLGLSDSTIAGTTRINIATACYVFKDFETSIKMFEEARRIYENGHDIASELKGGLYNNMGLSLTALGRYEEAMASYSKALQLMSKVPGGCLEQAETYLNMADAIESQLGMERAEQQIYELLDRAEQLLESPDLELDGYYAYVVDQCAPIFEHYGYFLTAQKLKEHSKSYYERS